MPTLDWIGKRAVVNHHRELPYRLLHCDDALSAGAVGAGNLLVEGDNLHALKALLPYYAGRVKCIYIDPPYNTGNEGWVYNDAANAPEIQKWLGETVGKEAEDLSRHDKWLCMMYPRLALLREFLAKDGVLMMSIDDNEVAFAKLLLNEILGAQNFVAQLVWEKGRKNDAKLFSVGHEYIFIYARSRAELGTTVWRAPKDGVPEIGAEYQRLRKQFANDFAAISKGLAAFYKKLPKGHPAKKYSRAKNADQRGVWRDNNITWPGGGGPKYDIPHPRTGQPCKVPEDGWRFIEDTMKQKIADDWVVFRSDHKKPPFLKSYIYMLEDSDDDDELNEGKKEVLGSVFYRHSQPSLDVMKAIFGEKVFPNPKDHEVLARLIRYVTNEDRDCLVLDSFAGSGTTGHATLSLNAQDGGNRRFILCEMEPKIAREITAERLRRVSAGYGETPGLGSGFRFCTLGEPMLDAEARFHPDVKWSDLGHHLWFTETGEPWSAECVATPGAQSFATGGPMLGVAPDGRAIYLLHSTTLGGENENAANTLTPETLAALAPHDGPRTVYGEACTLRATTLSRERITFKQIPYQVRQQ